MSDQFTPVPRPDETPTEEFSIPADTGTVVVNQSNFDTPANRELITSLPAIVRESKAGYKTTEFWVGILLSLLTVLDTIPLPEKFEGVVVGALGLAYILSRGIAKQSVPVVTPQTDDGSSA